MPRTKGSVHSSQPPSTQPRYIPQFTPEQRAQTRQQYMTELNAAENTIPLNLDNTDQARENTNQYDYDNAVAPERQYGHHPLIADESQQSIMATRLKASVSGAISSQTEPGTPQHDAAEPTGGDGHKTTSNAKGRRNQRSMYHIKRLANIPTDGTQQRALKMADSHLDWVDWDESEKAGWVYAGQKLKAASEPPGLSDRGSWCPAPYR